MNIFFLYLKPKWCAIETNKKNDGGKSSKNTIFSHTGLPVPLLMFRIQDGGFCEEKSRRNSSSRREWFTQNNTIVSLSLITCRLRLVTKITKGQKILLFFFELIIFSTWFRCWGGCLSYILSQITWKIFVYLLSYGLVDVYFDWYYRGAGQEVGRSCHFLEFKGKKVLVSKLREAQTDKRLQTDSSLQFTL